MNWYKTAKDNNRKSFYHATIPYYADEIIDTGHIKSSNKLGINYMGWSFSEEMLGHTYGDAVFLAKEDEKELAIYYAKERLSKLWNDQENIEKIAYDEDLRFIALFKVYISLNSKLLKRSKKDTGEYHYFGVITKNAKDDAYWTGPEWISCEKEADRFVKNKNKFHNELIIPRLKDN